MQKIIVLKPVPLLRANGGEIALVEKLEMIQSWGVKVRIVCALPEDLEKSFAGALNEFGLSGNTQAYEIGGLRVEVFFDRNFHPFHLRCQEKTENFFISKLREEEPDLVFTHYTDYFATAAGLRWNPKKTWIDQTDNEYPRLDRLKDFSDLSQVYQRAENFCVASQFMARQIQKDFPKAHIHLMPNILSEFEYPQVRSREFDPKLPWLFVNPAEVKGIDLILDLAKVLPQESFLICGNWSSSFPNEMPSNVQIIPRQNSLAAIWPRVKGLLMPSRWEEAFGRMPLEAMAHGVVVIASKRGGLPESVAEGGLLLGLEIEAWKEAMTREPSFWNQMIQKAFGQFVSYKAYVKSTYAALEAELKPGVSLKA